MLVSPNNKNAQNAGDSTHCHFPYSSLLKEMQAP